MDVKTFRAKSMHEALKLVSRELGSDATVLHTREVRGGLFRWLGARQIEVTASATVNVPRRMPARTRAVPAGHLRETDRFELAATNATTNAASTAPSTAAAPLEVNYRDKFRADLKGQLADLHSMVEDLCKQSEHSKTHDLPESLFRLFTDLIDAEVGEDVARELIDKVRTGTSGDDLNDIVLLKARLARLIEEEIRVCEPIRVEPGVRRLVAMVGPTGVGKTTTIAKLAANYRLREHRRVGLITVDTYRIAAVEQLRTYADIIDLPMEVVATPREMRAAMARMADLDLILMDTAGRSPKDEVRIQELKSLLAEAKPDEVHLVLSSVASVQQMKKAAEKFARVGVTSLLLTKLDEASGLGNLLPLVRAARLPISYVTNGQNVPDDIEPANRRKLARIVLGMEG